MTKAIRAYAADNGMVAIDVARGLQSIALLNGGTRVKPD